MRRLLSAFMCLFLLLSCSNRGSHERIAPAPRDADVLRMYNLYVNRKFADYVREVHANRGMPDFYLEQMGWLIQQHADKKRAESGGVSEVKVERIEQRGDYANVFLGVSYCDSSSEEILLPIVYEDDRWWIK